MMPGGEMTAGLTGTLERYLTGAQIKGGFSELKYGSSGMRTFLWQEANGTEPDSIKRHASSPSCVKDTTTMQPHAW